MPAKEKHVSGRLKSLNNAEHDDFGGHVLLDERDHMVADCNIFGPGHDESTNRANALRLAACWNAMMQLTTEEIARLDPSIVGPLLRKAV